VMASVIVLSREVLVGAIGCGIVMASVIVLSREALVGGDRLWYSDGQCNSRKGLMEYMGRDSSPLNNSDGEQPKGPRCAFTCFNESPVLSELFGHALI
jgi:hypothetical protein